MKPVSFESEHLKFRTMTKEDTDLVLKWRNSNEVRNNFLYREEITREEHLERFDTRIKTGEIIQFIVIEKESDTPIGSAYLSDIDPVNKSAEYGMFIGEEEARGVGYGSEIPSRVSEYFFEEMKYDKLYCRILRRNIASLKGCESAGFRECSALELGIEAGDYPEEIVFLSMTRKTCKDAPEDSREAVRTEVQDAV